MEIIDNTKPFIEYVKEAYMNKKVNRNLYENLIRNSKEEIVKHMKEFAIYIRDNILI